MKKLVIQSVPRSGSSWFGQIFNASPNVNYKFQPLFSYAFKGYLNENSSKQQIDEFFKSIAISDDSFINQSEFKEKNYVPKFTTNSNYSHVCYKEVRYINILKNMFKQDNGVIGFGLVRNPFAVIDSFLRSPREFRKDLGLEELKEWNLAESKNQGKPEEFYGFKKWCEAIDIFEFLEKEYPDRFKIIMYSDLLGPKKYDIIKSCFEFAGLELSEEVDLFLNAKVEDKQILQKTYSVFREKTDDNGWQNTLNPLIAQQIESSIKNTKYEKYKN